jgi:hypothetical protein
MYKTTYDGYAKFLKRDFAFSPLKSTITCRKKWKAVVYNIAKARVARGVV